jgi:predicted small integral membrane protein
MTRMHAVVSDVSRFGTLPVAITVLVLLNGLYILLAAIGNIVDFSANRSYVRHVLAMDTTHAGNPGRGGRWRAIEHRVLQDIAYIVIILWEALAAIVLLAATVAWVAGHDGDYATARGLSTVGLVMLILLFFGGCIVIGGEWFQMWKSTAWNGLDPAFRNTVLAIGTLILIHLPSGTPAP